MAEGCQIFLSRAVVCAVKQPTAVDTLTFCTRWVLLQMEFCQELYDTIRNHKTEDGRLLCESFIRVPKRRYCRSLLSIVWQFWPFGVGSCCTFQPSIWWKPRGSGGLACKIFPNSATVSQWKDKLRSYSIASVCCVPSCLHATGNVTHSLCGVSFSPLSLCFIFASCRKKTKIFGYFFFAEPTRNITTL